MKKGEATKSTYSYINIIDSYLDSLNDFKKATGSQLGVINALSMSQNSGIRDNFLNAILEQFKANLNDESMRRHIENYAPAYISKLMRLAIMKAKDPGAGLHIVINQTEDLKFKATIPVFEIKITGEATSLQNLQQKIGGKISKNALTIKLFPKDLMRLDERVQPIKAEWDRKAAQERVNQEREQQERIRKAQNRSRASLGLPSIPVPIYEDYETEEPKKKTTFATSASKLVSGAATTVKEGVTHAAGKTAEGTEYALTKAGQGMKYAATAFVGGFSNKKDVVAPPVPQVNTVTTQAILSNAEKEQITEALKNIGKIQNELGTIDSKYKLTPQDQHEKQHIAASEKLSSYYETMRKNFNEAFAVATLLSTGKIAAEEGKISKVTACVSHLGSGVTIGAGILAASCTEASKIRRTGRYSHLSDIIPSSDTTEISIFCEKLARAMTLTQETEILNSNSKNVRSISNELNGFCRDQLGKLSDSFARGLFSEHKSPEQLLSSYNAKTGLEYILNGSLERSLATRKEFADFDSRVSATIENIVQEVTGRSPRRLDAPVVINRTSETNSAAVLANTEMMSKVEQLSSQLKHLQTEHNKILKQLSAKEDKVRSTDDEMEVSGPGGLVQQINKQSRRTGQLGNNSDHRLDNIERELGRFTELAVGNSQRINIMEENSGTYVSRLSTEETEADLKNKADLFTPGF